MRDWQERVKLQPDNEWAVYEACKALGRSLAEYESTQQRDYVGRDRAV